MLPTEIWSRIFSYLLPRFRLEDTDRSALQPVYSLCLVNHQFRQTAQPLLYHTILLNRSDSGQAAMLLRSLFETPELARAVRKVTLHDYGLGSLLPNHRQLLEDVIRSLHIPETFRSYLEDSLNVPDDASFVVFVLLMTTRVQEVDLVPNMDDNAAKALLALLSGSIEALDEGNIQPPMTYQNFVLPYLKSISLTIGDEMCSSISGLESVLLRPGLEAICLRKVYWHLSEDDASQWPGGKSDLTSLTLLDSMINGYSVQDIFTRFPNLRVFNFDASDRFSGRQEDYDQEDDPEWCFCAAEVGHGLRTFGTKLKALTLRTTTYRSGEAWDGSLWDESPLGSLQAIGSLQKIEIDLSEFAEHHEDDCAVWAQNLVGILPASLEQLTVPDEHQTLGRVLELIGGQYFPTLRQITIVPTNDCKSWIPLISDEDIPGWTFALGVVERPWPVETFCFQKVHRDE